MSSIATTTLAITRLTVIVATPASRALISPVEGLTSIISVSSVENTSSPTDEPALILSS